MAASRASAATASAPTRCGCSASISGSRRWTAATGARSLAATAEAQLSTLAAFALVGVLSALALLHFGWATGRGPSLSGVVPTESGRPLFRPGPLACVAVGLALSLAALMCAVRAGWLLSALPGWVSQAGVGCVALAFGLRAIGDFRYVGFSKRIRDSLFARRDSWLYSPLCVVISILAVALAVARPGT